MIGGILGATVALTGGAAMIAAANPGGWPAWRVALCVFGFCFAIGAAVISLTLGAEIEAEDEAKEQA